MTIDLKKEQHNSLQRLPLQYGIAARFFFAAMDLAAGKKDTPAKGKPGARYYGVGTFGTGQRVLSPDLHPGPIFSAE